MSYEQAYYAKEKQVDKWNLDSLNIDPEIANDWQWMLYNAVAAYQTSKYQQAENIMFNLHDMMQFISMQTEYLTGEGIDADILMFVYDLCDVCMFDLHFNGKAS